LRRRERDEERRGEKEDKEVAEEETPWHFREIYF
jgi:hypothetical protein